MQAYSLKRENGVTPIVGLHRIPAKKHPYGALAGVKAPSFFYKKLFRLNKFAKQILNKFILKGFILCSIKDKIVMAIKNETCRVIYRIINRSF